MKRGSRKFKKIKTRINKGVKRKKSRLTKKRRRNVNTKKRRRNMYGGGIGLDSSKIMSIPKEDRSWTGKKRQQINIYPPKYNEKDVTFYLDNIRKDPNDENNILFKLKWTPTGITGGHFIDMKYINSPPIKYISIDSKDEDVFNTKEIDKAIMEKKVNNIFNQKINDRDPKTIIESILEIPDKIKELKKIKTVFTKFRTSHEYLKPQIDKLTENNKFETIITNYANDTVIPELSYTDENIIDIIDIIIAKADELLEKLSSKLDYLLNKKKLIGLSLDWDGCCAPYFLKNGKTENQQFKFIVNIINKIDEKTNNTASNVLIFVGSNRQSRDIDHILTRNFSDSKSALKFFNNNIEKLFNENTRNQHSRNSRKSPHTFKFMKGLISDNPIMFKLDTNDEKFNTITNYNDDSLIEKIDNKEELPVTKLTDEKNILSLYGNEIQNTTEVNLKVKNVSNHPFNFNFNLNDNPTAKQYNEINSKYEQDLKMWLNVYHMKKIIDLTRNIPIDIKYIFLDDREEFLQNLLNNELLIEYSPDVANKFKDKISCIKIDETGDKFEEIKLPT